MECNGIRDWDNEAFPDSAALAAGDGFWPVRWRLHPGYGAATVNSDRATIYWGIGTPVQKGINLGPLNVSTIDYPSTAY